MENDLYVGDRFLEILLTTDHLQLQFHHLQLKLRGLLVRLVKPALQNLYFLLDRSVGGEMECNARGFGDILSLCQRVWQLFPPAISLSLLRAS